MMKKKDLFLWMLSLIVCLNILIIGGCGTLSERRYEDSSEDRGGYKTLDVAPTLRFDDVPVPSGFKIIQDRSYSFLNDYSRVALLRYSGRVNADRVVSFYKEQMPLFNWELVNVVEYGTRMLSFQKEGQSCVITVEAGVGSTVLTIHVAPRASKPLSTPAKAKTPIGQQK